MHPSAPRCSAHPDALAGWGCEACHTLQCLDCAASLNGLPVCGTCGALPTVLQGHRAHVAPVATTWSAGLKELATPGAWVWIGVLTCALQFMLSIHAAPKLWVLGRLLMLAWLFYVTRRAGRDLPPFGPPTYGDLVSVWRGPLIRALPVLAPCAAFATWLVRFGRVAVPTTSLLDVSLAILTAPILAATLPTVAIEGDGRAWALPGRLREVSRILGPAYRPLLGLTAASLALALRCARLEPLNMEDTHMERAIARMFGFTLAQLTVLTLLGLLAGRLLVTFSEELGHDSGERATLPWVTAVPPRAWVPVKPEEHLLAAARAERFKPIELESTRPRFDAALAEGRLDDALAFLHRGELRRDQLPGEALITLAQALAARGEVRQAAELLEQLLTHPADPALARGQVILARLLAERLGQPDRARQLYEDVVGRYPGTPAAAFALERLTAS